MTGTQLVRLMRTHRVTIRELKRRTSITLKRIRKVRETGLTDAATIRDWIQAITGNDPGPMATFGV